MRKLLLVLVYHPHYRIVERSIFEREMYPVLK